MTHFVFTLVQQVTLVVHCGAATCATHTGHEEERGKLIREKEYNAILFGDYSSPSAVVLTPEKSHALHQQKSN